MKVLAVLLVIAGIVLGIWLGLVVMFIGGIIQFIHGVQATPASGHDMSWGIARFLCASFVGFVAGAALIYPGIALWDATDREKIKRQARARRDRYGQ